MSKWEPKEKRVDDIVNAAIEVFLEKGYEGASMENIALKAHMSKGGLYHHFKSKEEVLYYANNKLCEPLTAFIQEASSYNKASDGLKAYITNYIEYWSGHTKELMFFFLTLTKAMASEDIWPYYAKYYQDMEGFLTELYKKGIHDGSFKIHNTRGNARALLSALDGILVYLVVDRNLDKQQVILDFEDRFVCSVQLTTQ